MQSRGFVPVPLAPLPEREVFRRGFPRRAPHLAHAFPHNGAEVTFGVLRELHRINRKFPDMLVEIYAGFSKTCECCATGKQEPE